MHGSKVIEFLFVITYCLFVLSNKDLMEQQARVTCFREDYCSPQQEEIILRGKRKPLTTIPSHIVSQLTSHLERVHRRASAKDLLKC